MGDELDAVLAADINASQTLVALGGPQKIVRVFNVGDGSPVVEIRKHTDWVTAVEFSPDGVLLATADRAGGVWVWEAGTDREFQALEGHKAAVTAMSWRDDSNVLATASEDGTIALWAMENGKRIKNIPAHPGGATCLQFLHDGRLVSGGRDRTVKLWDAGGNQIRQFEPFGELVMKVAATHDGGRIVAGDWSGEVRLVSVADGKIVGSAGRESAHAGNGSSSSGRPRRRPPGLSRSRRPARPTRRKSCSTRSAVPPGPPLPRQPLPQRPPRASLRRKRRLRRRSNALAGPHRDLGQGVLATRGQPLHYTLVVISRMANDGTIYTSSGAIRAHRI